MIWEKVEFDRKKHPKKEPQEFEYAYVSEEYPNIGVCADFELSRDDVEMVAKRCHDDGGKDTAGSWVEVYQDEDFECDLVCGYHTGDIRAFERIRRITGYLVGTLERFNNGKAAEERDRVKHEI